MLNRRNLIVQEHLKKFVFSEYGIELSSLTMETPPRRELGDLAFPFPFQLAKSLRKNPRAIAQDIVDQSVQIPGVDRIEAAGGGFLNVFFNLFQFLFQIIFIFLKHAQILFLAGERLCYM